MYNDMRDDKKWEEDVIEEDDKDPNRWVFMSINMKPVMRRELKDTAKQLGIGCSRLVRNLIIDGLHPGGLNEDI